MLFHKVAVEKPADEILREVGCKLEKASENLFLVDTAEMIAKLAVASVNAGAKIIFGVSVVDLIFRENPTRIEGVVIQWTPVIMSGLHVDPIGIKAKAVIDCTGHEAEVITVASKKIPKLKIELKGEGSMWVYEGEKQVVEYTGEICPGLYAAGMSVSALKGTPRMGPIFGGMLLSGKKIAEIVKEKLKA